MNTYVLKRNEDKVGWDEAAGFVVNADTENQARLYASEQAGDEGPDVWLDPGLSACTMLSNTPARGVVLRDYRAA